MGQKTGVDRNSADTSAPACACRAVLRMDVCDPNTLGAHVVNVRTVSNVQPVSSCNMRCACFFEAPAVSGQAQCAVFPGTPLVAAC